MFVAAIIFSKDNMKNKMKTLAITMTLSLSSFPLVAGEADHFTNREHQLKDSRTLVNSMAAASLNEALSEANKKSPNGCNEKLLYSELAKYFGNHVKGKFTRKVISDKRIEKRDTSVYDSVYQDWKFYDGTLIASPIVKQFALGMSPVMNLGGIEIGTDKFEHLFGQGLYYFTLNKIQKKSLLETLTMGTLREMNDMGGSRWQTGVMSYGDLSANFNGLRFWNHILQKENDLLGIEHNVGPYVECERNIWVKSKEIDFSEYFDDSADESINCSNFATEKNLQHFTSRISQLGYSCPVDSKRRDVLKDKYGKFFKWIVNSGSNSITDYQVHFSEL
jgi:hypothetical protein